MQKIKKHLRGSVLIYTLFILGILLVSVLSFASVTLMQEKSAIGTGDSVQSFQVANSAAERVVSRYLNQGADHPNELAGLVGSTCDDSDGIATIDVAIVGGSSKITFADKNGDYLATCTRPLITADTIRSAGSFKGATRAIETAFGDPPVGERVLLFESSDSDCDPKALYDYVDAGGMLIHAVCRKKNINSFPTKVMALDITSNTGVESSLIASITFLGIPHQFKCSNPTNLSKHNGKFRPTNEGTDCNDGWGLYGPSYLKP